MKIKHGKDYKQEKNINAAYPVLGTGGVITYIDTFLCDWNCVCIGRKGTINKPIYMDEPFWSVDTLFYSIPNVRENPKFQYYLFQTINWLKYNAASGVPSLSSSTIESIPISRPFELEQKKISTFLTVLDNKIKKQEELIEAIKSYKRGLLSSIFEQKICFNNKSIWMTNSLGFIFSERVERASGSEELLSVTIENGIQKRENIETKDNSSKNKSNYKKVYINDIAYNTMRMWQGASGHSLLNGIVSPAYTVIKLNDNKNHSIKFWAFYFKHNPLIKKFQKYSQGLTSDTWNLKYPQFARIQVNYPPYEDQIKIVNILEGLDELIFREEKTLEYIIDYKVQLLQKMFI